VIVRKISGTPDAQTLSAAVRCIRAGGTLIFPTETVYGIGCDPDDARAVEAIFAAKRRPAGKPLTVHLADPGDAVHFAVELSAGARAVIDAFWPGPVAVVVRRTARCAAAARGGQTIALRCPADATCLTILRATGPLAATSANVSDKPAFTGASEDLASLPEATLALIAGPTSVGRESTVLDCTAEAIRILRRGALEIADIERALSGVAPLAR